MSDEKFGGILNQGPKKEISVEDTRKLIDAAIADGNLLSQLHYAKEEEEEQADMLRRMQDVEEYNKKNSFYVSSANQIGWVCPKCGGVNAPFVQRCPCVPLQVTCYNT